MGWLSWIFGGFSGLIHLISEVLQRWKEKELVEQGKQQGQSELAVKIAKEEQEISKKQNEILMTEQPPEEVVKKLEDGKF